MTDNELVELAAKNNAEWCNIICAAHNSSGHFTDKFWVNIKQVPKYYPNFITLKQFNNSDSYIGEIQKLIKKRKGIWSIKDSFAQLDLSKLGFDKLFDAHWITYARERPIRDISDTECRSIDTVEELKKWETSWNIDENLNLFKLSLIDDKRVQFYGCYEDSEIMAGAIINISEQVVGISNIFYKNDDHKTYWSALTSAIKNNHNSKLIVGYEGGNVLDDAISIGYEPIGKLSIWQLDN